MCSQGVLPPVDIQPPKIGQRSKNRRPILFHGVILNIGSMVIDAYLRKREKFSDVEQTSRNPSSHRGRRDLKERKGEKNQNRMKGNTAYVVRMQPIQITTITSKLPLILPTLVQLTLFQSHPMPRCRNTRLNPTSTLLQQPPGSLPRVPYIRTS